VKAVLAVMARLGLMVFPMLAVAVAVMVIQALVLVVLVVLAVAALAMVTGLQHQQPQVQRTAVGAAAVRGHLAMALVAAQVLLFSVTLIRFLLLRPLQGRQRLPHQADTAITHLPDQVQSRFKS
jgi:hypothetical protein